MADIPDKSLLPVIGQAVAVITSVAAWPLWGRAKLSTANSRIDHLTRTLSDLASDLQELKREMDSLSEKMTEYDQLPDRLRRIEVSAMDTRRELRDSVAELQDAVTRSLRRIEAAGSA